MSIEEQDFVVERNIERFTRLLTTEKDHEKRAMLLQLLREEQAKRNNGLIETTPDE